MPKKRYTNYEEVKNNNSLSLMFRWTKERLTKRKDLTKVIEQAANKDPVALANNHTKLSITWIGHSTFLIQLNGLNILTDPVWANRMGVQKRMTKPGLTLDELPPIDVVLISHGHYDHLHFSTIKQLKGNITFFVPIGLKSLFKKKGYKQVVEANWWESFIYAGKGFHFVPAQHWTRRSIFDTNTSHWGGWIVEDPETNRSVYFVGDTGYFKGFKAIEEKHDIDIVLMPIGAYEPEYFMSVSHINPEDAVKAFLELKGNHFVPMHYGAYRLADDTGPEALDRLLAEWKRLELDEEKLSALKIGETFWVEPNESST